MPRKKKPRKPYKIQWNFPDTWLSEMKDLYISLYYIQKRRKVLFKPSFEQFEQLLSQPCKYCGNEDITLETDLTPICTRCNSFKGKHTDQAFRQMIKAVSRHIF